MTDHKDTSQPWPVSRRDRPASDPDASRLEEPVGHDRPAADGQATDEQPVPATGPADRREPSEADPGS